MTLQAERAERARNGSRRKRDLEALAALEAAEVVEAVAAVTPDPVAAEVWTSILDDLGPQLPAPAVECWLDPLRAVGAVAGDLAVTGPARHVAWCRVRFHAVLADAIRRDGRFTGLAIFDEPEAS